jgi:hypothetical protein
MLPSEKRCVLFALTLICNAAAADSYVCHPETGSTVSNDHFPPECEGLETRVLNRDGSLKELIPPHETPEQRQTREAQNRRPDLQKTPEQKQKDLDQWLRDRYHSLKDIEADRQRALENPRAAILLAEAKLDRNAKELEKLDAEAQFYAKREMPRELVDRYKNNEVSTAFQERIKEEMKSEIARINEKFDSYRQRFEELERMIEKGIPAGKRNTPRPLGT